MAETRYRIIILLTPAFVLTAGSVQKSTNEMSRFLRSIRHKLGYFCLGYRV